MPGSKLSLAYEGRLADKFKGSSDFRRRSYSFTIYPTTNAVAEALEAENNQLFGGGLSGEIWASYLC